MNARFRCSLVFSLLHGRNVKKVLQNPVRAWGAEPYYIASSPAAPAVEDEQGSPSAAEPEAVDAKAASVDAKAEPVDAEPDSSSVHDAEHRPLRA